MEAVAGHAAAAAGVKDGRHHKWGYVSDMVRKGGRGVEGTGVATLL